MAVEHASGEYRERRAAEDFQRGLDQGTLMAEQFMAKAFAKGRQVGVAEERERCAKVAESWAPAWRIAATQIAAEIREGKCSE